MGKKKKAGSEKSGWKQVRIRPEWLDLIREAHKKNPAFSPTVDLSTASEPNLIHVACQVASLSISGWLWERLTPHIDQIVDRVRLDAAVRVAGHFGGRVVTNDDGSISVIKPDGKMPDFPTVPTPQQLPRPTMFH